MEIVCPHCNQSFSYNTSSAPLKSRLGDVKGITISKEGSDLIIERRWFHPTAYLLVFFCIFWDGILVLFYTLMLSGENTPLFAKLFPLGHVTVGLGLTYYTLCMFLNKTSFRVGFNGVSVRHAPLPWFGAKSFQRSEIQQLFVKKKVTHGKNGTTVTYSVETKLADGKSVTMADSMQVYDQALKIEQEIETALGIKDAVQTEEYRP